MKTLKMFIAGMAFPSTVLPFLLLIAWSFGKTPILSNPFLHFIPLIWGIWNILYFTLFLKFLPGDAKVKLLITGAALGFLIAFYGVFGLNLPLLMGLPKFFSYVPLIMAPLLYAIFWLFIVGPLNDLLGVYEDRHTFFK